ncbi:MAG: hypothetical protein ACK5GV_01095 [Bacteroidota bacterium]|jgi:hypothetical protein
MFYYLRHALDFVAFRTTKRYNVIKIRSLRPNYYDKDTLLLHAVMQLVVDYVEIELVPEPDTKIAKLLSKLPWFIRPTFRSPTLGFKNLEQIIDEKVDLNWLDFHRKLKEVYIWWTQVYPNRKSVEELSGYTQFFENRHKYSKTYCHKKQKHIFDKITKLELQYAKEEADMLKAVIDYRQFLWT